MAIQKRPMLREALLALCVIVLVFLNFGHTSAVFAAGGRVVVTANSICGDPAAPSAGDHFACHACRPDLAALPPPPAAVLPVAFCIAPIAYANVEFALIQPRRILTAAPRGPPLV